MIIFIAPLWSQDTDTEDKNSPDIDIQIRDSLEYERPARLKEEDYDKGRTFRFEPGLEIITDVEYVKVYIRMMKRDEHPLKAAMFLQVICG